MSEPETERDILVGIRDSLVRLTEMFEDIHTRIMARPAPSPEEEQAAKEAVEEARPVAARYLAALEAGDATAANQLGRVNPDLPNNEFLRQEVYTHAEHLTDAQIISVQRAGWDGGVQEVRVQVAFQLAGETIRDTLLLTKDKGEWWVSDGLTYTLPRSSRVEVRGELRYTFPGARVPVELYSFSQGKIYPGVYALTAPNPFYEMTGEVTVSINRDNSALSSTEYTMLPNQNFIDFVQKVVDERFAEAITYGTVETLRGAGMQGGHSTFFLGGGQAPVNSLTVLEPPVVSVRANETNPFVVSDARVLMSVSGTDFHRNPVTEDVIGTFRHTIRAEVTGETVNVTVLPH
jgi:hypothetical protein